MITIMNNLFKVLNSISLEEGTINSNNRDHKGESGKNLMYKTPATREELDEIAERFGAGSHMLVQFAVQYGAMIAYEEALSEIYSVRTFVELLKDLDPEG